MQQIVKTLERIHAVSGIPLSLLDGEGHLLNSFPPFPMEATLTSSSAAAIEDFRLQRRDIRHSLISFLEPGFLLGVMQVTENCFVLIGLVSPLEHSRADILKMAAQGIAPAYLQEYCDGLMQQPKVSLETLKDLICLLTELLVGAPAESKDILFVDNVSAKKLSAQPLNRSLFEQREEERSHIPQDFESAICSAVEAGDRVLLERALLSPMRGHIGRMSVNELRQQKYTFICMAVLASRAAIRGGMSAETAFSLSDLYCQRADVLTETALIQNLTFTMLMDFCGKVQERRKKPEVSLLTAKCLDYISVHLHGNIGLEELSNHCGLCSRSLSLRFKEELGMGIPEYIHREKIREAEYLLRHTDHSLSEITSYLNYPSQSYFTQIFKKFTGQTPQKFRDKRG